MGNFSSVGFGMLLINELNCDDSQTFDLFILSISFDFGAKRNQLF